MHTVQANETDYDISPKKLKEGSIFGALSPDAIQYLLDNGIIHEAHQGDEVFHYNDKGESFYAVLHGSLDFFKQHDHKALHTRDIGFGEALGFVSMIALHDRVGTAYAKEDSLLLEVSSTLFSDFHDQYPFDFGILLMNLARDMARNIRELSNALVSHETESTLEQDS
ncbi:Crp/Fnr family transcriptional regulator [Marinomonas pollencensis]|uniref:Cyclic nucleotide-binding protein n=1 Tax=Marinomonas pollencensis TaxID=491954 RepID=A0A3E0DV24_9GAMM|nr:cyclic nucleotide-binding domain-containing protein [Marinomonas pollencensis]REG85509.1 cyclic nucleotide-binding protein [Marinomonas pollencensis]